MTAGEWNLSEQLINIVGEKNVKQQEMMSAHTTFRVGGPADFFVQPDSEEEIKQILNLCKESGTGFFVLGNGSNLLVSDAGIRGIVIRLGNRMSNIHIAEPSENGQTEVSAQAGVSLAVLVAAMADKGLAGLEAAGGIPGSLGGGVMMNAGAYGTELGEYLKEAVLLLPDGSLRHFTKEEMHFGYRHSAVMENGGIVLSAVFSLPQGNRAEIKEKIKQYNQQRRDKQPLEYPSAGSTFKRPEGNFAGKLIMEAGLAGFSVGNAQISEKHCGFVINRGGACAAEIAELMRQVSERVWQNSGIRLEPEVRFAGENFRWSS